LRKFELHLLNIEDLDLVNCVSPIIHVKGKNIWFHFDYYLEGKGGVTGGKAKIARSILVNLKRYCEKTGNRKSGPVFISR